MTTTPIRSDWVGRVIDGRFTLHQWLGGSEWSGVFQTDLEGHGSQKAALRLIAADAADLQAYIARWTVATAQSHPHLMRLFHTGRCEIEAVPLLYAVTEYAEENLAEILPERPLTPTETREMLEPVLDALACLHRQGFVHGHLKPSNIMVVDNQLKLCWARLYVAGEAGTHFPAAGIYGAPEFATGTISPAADAWSLGVTVVEALTQHPPVWDRSAHNEPVVPESIPQPFFDIAQECLRIDPMRRCTLGDIGARIQPAQALPVQALPVQAAPVQAAPVQAAPVQAAPVQTPPVQAPLSQDEKTAVPRSSRRLVPALVVLAVLVLVVAVGAMMMRSHDLRTHSSDTSSDEQQFQPGPRPESPGPAAQSTAGETVDGSVVERVLPDVLPAATASIHGQFDLSIRVHVDASGNVSKAEFDEPGPSKYFGRVALEAAQRWKFKPPQVDGRAVSSVWLLEFQFTQAGTEIDPTEVSP